MASGGSAAAPKVAANSDIPIAEKRGGRFVIPWEGFSLPGIKTIFSKFVIEKSKIGLPSQEILEVQLPVATPKPETLSNPPPDEVQATWLGHATVLVQMEGVNFLTDPVFSDYCGPVQMSPVPKRYRKVPCAVDDLPRIDAVVISHNHYDHLDVASVQQLQKKFGVGITWFVPMGLKQWMIDTGCPTDNVIELTWTHSANMVNGNKDMKFVFTPAQHWSKRGAFDNNKVLWGSWCVIGKSKKFYFAGDTGYCGVFKQIGEKFGPFNLAAIPIGAYSPREMMHCQHVNPEEAWKIHIDVKAIRSLGIHWGTFNLSHEPYLEPKNLINDHSDNQNPRTFDVVNPGETITC